MYNIILFVITLTLLIVFFYIFLKKYKAKEGFTIGSNANLATSALTNTSNYKDNLGSIINQLKGELNLDEKRDDINEILQLHSKIIKLTLLKKFLNHNLNSPDDSLLTLNQQALFSLNSQNNTGADVILQEVMDTSGAPKLTSSSGGMFTSLLGLN
jgi:hypothetical protein